MGPQTLVRLCASAALAQQEDHSIRLPTVMRYCHCAKEVNVTSCVQ